MQKAVPTKNRGFTLIELMLVLALIVALTVAGIEAYQIQLRNFRVDKTALQMQQWLQAGQAFQVDCKRWPKVADTGPQDPMMQKMMGLSELGDTCPGREKEKRAYMPDGSQNGPWINVSVPGSPATNNFYQIGPTGKNPDNHDPVDSPNFYVETVLSPSDQTPQGLAAIDAVGKMIAGRLPNASSQPNDFPKGSVRIRAYVGKSGGGSSGGNVGAQILDMEIVDSAKTAEHIKKPDQKTCDAFGPNLIPVLVGSLAGVDAGGTLDTKRNSLMRTYLAKMTIDSKGFISQIDTDPKTDLLQPNALTQISTLDRHEPGYPEGYWNTGNRILLISACLPAATVNPKLQDSASSSLSPSNSIRY